jgi:hypothetical protein
MIWHTEKSNTIYVPSLIRDVYVRIVLLPTVQYLLLLIREGLHSHLRRHSFVITPAKLIGRHHGKRNGRSSKHAPLVDATWTFTLTYYTSSFLLLPPTLKLRFKLLHSPFSQHTATYDSAPPSEHELEAPAPPTRHRALITRKQADTMFRAQSNIFDDVVVKATDENLTSENWEYILVRSALLGSLVAHSTHGALYPHIAPLHLHACWIPRALLTESDRMYATKSDLPTRAPKMRLLP